MPRSTCERASLGIPATAARNMVPACATTAELSADVIASLYWEGKGVQQDRKLAVEWLKRGAAAGNPHSHVRLAYLSEHGEEVEHSLDRALFHWAMAERLYGDAELKGIEPAGSSAYPRGRRIALSREMPAKNVAQVGSEVWRWVPGSVQ
jgi:TPR repeat protein